MRLILRGHCCDEIEQAENDKTEYHLQNIRVFFLHINNDHVATYTLMMINHKTYVKSSNTRSDQIRLDSEISSPNFSCGRCPNVVHSEEDTKDKNTKYVFCTKYYINGEIQGQGWMKERILSLLIIILGEWVGGVANQFYDNQMQRHGTPSHPIPHLKSMLREMR